MECLAQYDSHSPPRPLLPLLNYISGGSLVHQEVCSTPYLPPQIHPVAESPLFFLQARGEQLQSFFRLESDGVIMFAPESDRAVPVCDNQGQIGSGSGSVSVQIPIRHAPVGEDE